VFEHPDFEEACRFLRDKARRLSRRSDFRNQDAEDVEQDLLLKLCRSRHRFDPARGTLHSFVNTVTERELASLARRQRAAKRNPTGSVSLTSRIPGHDGSVELGSTLLDSEAHRHRGQSSRSSAEEAELRLDIDEVARTLLEPLRDLADRLMREKSAQVARDRNVPRTTQNEELKRLRRRFERSDLDQYF
jgi:RNA polymerase sigma factor (sigma-70 family)